MPFQQHGPRLRMLTDEDPDAARHVEARSLVVQPDGLVAECVRCELPAVRCRGQSDDGVRMRVVDVGRRDERVKQRLDRRPRLVGAHAAAQEVLDHRRVVQLVTAFERKQLLEP